MPRISVYNDILLIQVKLYTVGGINVWAIGGGFSKRPKVASPPSLIVKTYRDSLQSIAPQSQHLETKSVNNTVSAVEVLPNSPPLTPKSLIMESPHLTVNMNIDGEMRTFHY